MLDPRMWHPNVRWLAIRIAALPVIFVVVSFASYFLLFGPVGDDPAIAIGGPGITDAQRRDIREEFNLEDPWYVAYFEWLGDATVGDFGMVYFNGQSVGDALDGRTAPSLEQLLIAAMIAAPVGLALAYAMTRRSAFGRVGVSATAFMAAVPLFFLARVEIIYRVRWWDFSDPVGGYVAFIDDPRTNLELMIPPGVLAGIATAPIIAITALSEQIFETRRGRGAFAIRALAAWFPFASASLIITEPIYSIRGLGEFFYRSAFAQDRMVTQLLLSVATFIGIALWVFVPRPRTPRSTPRAYTRPLLRDPFLLAGGAIVALFVIVGLFGEWLAPHEARALFVDSRYESPSWSHPLGTNQLGQDVLSRVMEGAWFSLRYGALVTIGGFVPGAAVGIALTRVGGRFRVGVSQLAAIPLGAPVLLWLMAVIGVQGFLRFGFPTAPILALGSFALLAGLVTGVNVRISPGAVSTRQVVANACISLAPACLAVFSAAILLHVTLNPDAPVPNRGTWGQQMLQGTNQGFEYPHLLWGPAGVVIATVFAINLVALTLYAARRNPGGFSDDGSGTQVAVLE